jgi:hypothetical protein
MTFSLILFVSAFAISSVAAYYSVAGLVAIFSSAVYASIVMGAALEVAKLVAASWLYRNWKEAPKFLKYYFTIAVLILSLITSMGIFGYLSKAHLDQSVVTGDVSSQVQLIDDKIKTQKDNIEVARKALKQMDESVDQVMARSTDEKGADKAAALRRSQQKERNTLLTSIGESQKSITKLQEEKAPIAGDLRKIEAEVGPIKYVAELIYGESSIEVIDKAVRLVILLIIMVFDPLAILLLIAANMEMRKGAPRKSADEVAAEEKEEKVMQWTTSALVTPRKPSKPRKPKKPSLPKRSKPVVPKKKPTTPKKKPSPPRKKPVTPKKRPLKKKSVDRSQTPLDDVITIKKSTVYRFDG